MISSLGILCATQVIRFNGSTEQVTHFDSLGSIVLALMQIVCTAFHLLDRKRETYVEGILESWQDSASSSLREFEPPMAKPFCSKRRALLLTVIVGYSSLAHAL